MNTTATPNGGASPSINHFRAELPRQMLKTQDPAVETILRRFRGIAFDALQSRPLDDLKDEQRDEADVRRPHQVFCIDGGRGAGKTYTLLSFDFALRVFASRLNMGRSPIHQPPSEFDIEWRSWFLKIDPKFLDGPSTAGRPRKLAHILRIIFPGDMEGGESLMESIFASMTKAIESISADDEEKKKKKKEIAEHLREKVAQGWYFSRRFGHEAILRDSIDYRDLVENFEKEYEKAATKIASWREFLSQYLDFVDAATLVVLVDDSDVRPELTHDILHSIRMFLNHPRIVTVLAGNLRAMRTSLLHIAMRQIGTSIPALNEEKHRTAVGWRRTEYKSIEDYLEKVLPPAQRFFLRRPKDVDFKSISGQTLFDFCTERMHEVRDRFLDAKYSIAAAREAGDRQPLGLNEPKRRDLEDFISWWAYRDWYTIALGPRSARQMTTLSDYFPEDPAAKDPAAKDPAAKDPARHRKRLPVVLFDMPDNYTLIQRLTDDDIYVSRWLRQQTLSSSWVGRRMFYINDRDIDHGSYTYDFIRYRLDLGLGLPLRDDPEEALPVALLPKLKGRRHMRHFFQPHNMPRLIRRLGASKWIDHAAVPGNCAYFHDVDALPDVSLIANKRDGTEDTDEITELQKGSWEAGLADTWIDLIEDAQGERLVHYFTEVVCGRLALSKDFTSAQLMARLDPPGGGDTPAILYDHFLDREYYSFEGPPHDPKAALQAGVANAHAKARSSGEGASATVKDVSEQSPDFKGQRERMIALYAALVNDLRRGWHAIRVHERSRNLGGANESRMPLYTLESLQEVFYKSAFGKLLEAFSRGHLSKIGSHGEWVQNAYQPTPWENVGDEESDHKEWVKNMRQVGRLICEQWPIPPDTSGGGAKPKAATTLGDAATLGDATTSAAAATPGDVMKEEDWILIERKIFGAKPWLEVLVEKGAARDDNNEGNSRAARQLVWLLYGLAPSLPAIIHMELVSEIYGFKLRGLPDSEKKPGTSDVEIVRNKINKKIKQWKDFVQELSISFRYVKMKCLQLYAVIVCDQLTPSETMKDPQEMDKIRDLGVKFIIERCNVKFLSGGEFEKNRMAEHLMKAVRSQFKKPQKEAATGLAIMPDMAPSTLFGDSWMADIIADEAMLAELKKAGCSGIDGAAESSFGQDMKGIFGETEQWLWATDRCLKKFRARADALLR